ncbi:ribonuclease HI, partial [Rhizobium ruizarguesonis]
MTDISNELRSPAATVGIHEPQHGLHVFVEGCYEPGSGHGGWAFVAYRD